MRRETLSPLLAANGVTGVGILAGSDAGEFGVDWGIGIHQELKLMVAAGLSEAEVTMRGRRFNRDSLDALLLQAKPAAP